MWLLLIYILLKKTIAQDNCTLADAIEQIDIGGPAMVRASAKIIIMLLF